MRNFVRNKDDPLVVPVVVEEVINPHFAKVQHSSGRADTVSTSSLAPGPTTNSNEENSAPDATAESVPLMQNDDSDEEEVNSKSQEEALGGGFPFVRPVRERRPPKRYIME